MTEETGFNPEIYTHVLPEGQEDFQDFTDADLQQNPELGYTDEQVEAEVEKMTEEEKSLYSRLRTSRTLSIGSMGTSYPWVTLCVCI